MVAALVERDLPQPRDERPLRIEALQRRPGGNEAVLQEVERVIVVADVAANESIQPPLVTLHEQRERSVLAGDRALRERLVRLLGRRRDVTFQSGQFS